jgi:hypothetical protein
VPVRVHARRRVPFAARASHHEAHGLDIIIQILRTQGAQQAAAHVGHPLSCEQESRILDADHIPVTRL